MKRMLVPRICVNTTRWVSSLSFTPATTRKQAARKGIVGYLVLRILRKHAEGAHREVELSRVSEAADLRSQRRQFIAREL
jgi:hypothetical protein